MKKQETKFYFRDVDSTTCERIEDILHDAKLDELTEVTVLEAIPDDKTSGYVWCNLYDCTEESNCKKSVCSAYKSKSGRGRCDHKGNLFFHGEKVTFKVSDYE